VRAVVHGESHEFNQVYYALARNIALRVPVGIARTSTQMGSSPTLEDR